MTDAAWRSRIRWVVAHPHRPAVLMVERQTARSPAYWLRKVLAGLRQVGRAHR